MTKQKTKITAVISYYSWNKQGQKLENNNALQTIIKNSFEKFSSILEKSIKSGGENEIGNIIQALQFLVFILLTKNYQSWLFK